jgi:hypothetical protein
MSGSLWLDIEALVLDGVPLNSVDGRRLAQLTEIALARLLQQRGTSAIETRATEHEPPPRTNKPIAMSIPSGANEARWAEELALVLYRALDRTL